MGAPRSPKRTPDFLSSFLALAHFMRLSLMKAHTRVLVEPRAENPDTWAENDGAKPPKALENEYPQHIRGCTLPRFPVEPRGPNELYAPFLAERRTRGIIQRSEQEIRGISLVFREMWDTTSINQQLYPN
jgi:hypothetical protein